MHIRRFFTLIMILGFTIFTVVGILRVVARSSHTQIQNTQESSLFSETFNGNTLDSNKWITETGTPIVQNGWLTLTATSIYHNKSFSAGRLQSTIQSSDWKPQNSSTDSSFGLEIWEGADGKCHYGIVFIASGYLGLLRSKPDQDNNCADQSAEIPDRENADPYYQDFLPIPSWEEIITRGKINFTLTWSEEVTLVVSNGITTSQVHTKTSMAIPDVPLNIRLNSKYITETFSIDYIELQANQTVYLPIVMNQLPPVTVSASTYPLQNTGLMVTTGDKLEFLASGSWNCGNGITDANGYYGVHEANAPDPNANLCALIGVISTNTPNAGDGFLIGTSNQMTATQSGILYVGSNDNLGKCDGSNLGSCYQDNQGSILISINRH